MSTVTTLVPVATRPALVKMPMSEEEYLALGETKHLEYYDEMCVVNPPSVRHQRAARAVFRVLDPSCPAGGLPWYWLVDLDEPSLVVLQLHKGVYVEMQRLTVAGVTIGPLQAKIDPAALA